MRQLQVYLGSSPVVLLGALLLSGCTVDKEVFPTKAANALCPQYKKCQLGYFESVFGDMATCKSDMNVYAEDLVYVMENGLACTYDEVEATKCLNEISSMSCEEFYDTSTVELACMNAFTGCIEQ